LNQKKYDLAQKFFSDALQIDQKIFGTLHMDVAIRLTNLGLLFEEQGLYEKALEFLKKAVEIYEKMRHTELEIDKIQVAIDRINKQISH
jgi:tetratricopeptide (TPR) repeat protein